MKVVIVEDEIAASENLKHLITKIDTSIEIVHVLASVNGAVSYFSNEHEVDLIFMDIHLADGISFEIFDQVTITTPIIFTTAYDHYAIKAFKVNSVDYLLKPIDEEELEAAIKKFRSQSGQQETVKIEDLLSSLKNTEKRYKSNYLLTYRDELVPVKTESIAYFQIDTGVVKATTFENKNYPVDKKLEDLEKELNPALFDRVNRQYIINKNAIKAIKKYFGGKLILQTIPATSERIVVSKAKTPLIKQWLNT